MEQSQDLFVESFGESVDDDPKQPDSDYWKLYGEQLASASISCFPEPVSEETQIDIRGQVRAQLAARSTLHGVTYAEARQHLNKIKEVTREIRELERENARMRVGA